MDVQCILHQSLGVFLGCEGVIRARKWGDDWGGLAGLNGGSLGLGRRRVGDEASGGKGAGSDGADCGCEGGRGWIRVLATHELRSEEAMKMVRGHGRWRWV